MYIDLLNSCACIIMYIHLLYPAENDPAITIGAAVGGGVLGGLLLLLVLTLGVVFVVYRVKKTRFVISRSYISHKINLLKLYICMQLINAP